MPNIDAGWITLPSTLGAIFVALWRGWLIPGPTLDRLTKQWESRLEEAQHWKIAHDRQQEIAAVATAQAGELLKQLGVIESFIRATPDAIVRLHALSQEENKP